MHILKLRKYINRCIIHNEEYVINNNKLNELVLGEHATFGMTLHVASFAVKKYTIYHVYHIRCTQTKIYNFYLRICEMIYCVSKLF